MSRRVTYFNSSFASFRPINLAGSQLYFAKNTATPSLWNDQSPNGYDISQGTAIQQPTIGVDTIDFDGSNDIQFNTVTSPFIGDSLGIIYFNGNIATGVSNAFLYVSGSTGTLGRLSFQLIFNGSVNRMQISIRDNSLSVNNVIRSTNTFTTGNIYGYIKSTGTGYELMVNGVIETLSFVSGSNNGSWFNTIGATDRISIGGIFTGSTIIYNPASVNKIYYNNTALSPSDITKLNNFFSDPNKY